MGCDLQDVAAVIWGLRQFFGKMETAENVDTTRRLVSMMTSRGEASGLLIHDAIHRRRARIIRLGGSTLADIAPRALNNMGRLDFPRVRQYLLIGGHITSSCVEPESSVSE